MSTPKQEQLPASTEVTEVAPGVLRMQLPIAMPGLGHVNTYALIGNEGVTLIDPGLPGTDSWKALQTRLSDAGIALSKITEIVVTHSHPDHYGGVRALLAVTSARMVAETGFGHFVLAPGVHECGADARDEGGAAAGGADANATDDNHVAKYYAHSPRHERVIMSVRSKVPDNEFRVDGWDGPVWTLPRPWNGRPLAPPLTRRQLIGLKLGFKKYFRQIVPPPPGRLVVDGEKLRAADRDWICVHTPGHTLDHLCLFDPANGVLISGDHVLPTITPHIPGVGGGPDPLGGFLSSLTKVADTGTVSLTLPADGNTFENFDERVEQIRVHHAERLATLKEILGRTGAANVEELSHGLFRESRWGPMAESEAFAHLENLRLSGDIVHHVSKGELVYELA